MDAVDWCRNRLPVLRRKLVITAGLRRLNMERWRLWGRKIHQSRPINLDRVCGTIYNTMFSTVCRT